MTDAEWAKVQAAPKGWVRSLVQKAKAPQARRRTIELSGRPAWAWTKRDADVGAPLE
jgi:hypothetical protein